MTLLLVASAAVGCATREPARRELASARAASLPRAPALVILPRTCVVEKRVADRHAPPRPLGATATERLREALDGLAPETRVGDRVAEDCAAPPDLSRPSALGELRASPHTMAAMRARGAEVAVVLAIDAVHVCGTGGAALLAHYGGTGLATTAALARTESCGEESVSLSAYVFASDGAAVWAARRDVDVDGDVDAAVDALLARVPVAMPPRTKRVKCRLDDKGAADCT